MFEWYFDPPDCEVTCYRLFNFYYTAVHTHRWLKPHSEPAAVMGHHHIDYEKSSVQPGDYELIGLPYDGRIFMDRDAASFIKTIQMLQDSGYRIPESLLQSFEHHRNKSKDNA